MPFETLDLTGMDIDSVEWEDAVLEADYGGGYHDGVNVGPLGGLHTWALSSGCLPDDDTISPIGLESRFAYYFDFFKARKAEGNSTFIIEFREANYHAGFVDPRISMERFTNDLFAGGVLIKQRRVAGEAYNADGSIDE
jgi:hypothetical protein